MSSPPTGRSRTEPHLPPRRGLAGAPLRTRVAAGPLLPLPLAAQTLAPRALRPEGATHAGAARGHTSPTASGAEPGISRRPRGAWPGPPAPAPGLRPRLSPQGPVRLWRPQPEPLGAVRRAATPLGSVQWGLSVVVAPWWLRPRVARVSRTKAGRPAGPGLRPWGPCSRLLPSPGSEGQEAPRRVLSDLSCHRGRSSRGRGRLAGGPHRCLVAASASVHSKLGGAWGLPSRPQPLPSPGRPQARWAAVARGHRAPPCLL